MSTFSSAAKLAAIDRHYSLGNRRLCRVYRLQVHGALQMCKEEPKLHFLNEICPEFCKEITKLFGINFN